MVENNTLLRLLQEEKAKVHELKSGSCQSPTESCVGVSLSEGNIDL